jgi:hypothetical protein
MMTDNPFEAVQVAGNFGYVQVTPTAAERDRGYTSAWMVVDFSQIEEDGEPAFVYSEPFATDGAAYTVARQLHRYYASRGDELNRMAIREWADELTGGRA